MRQTRWQDNSPIIVFTLPKKHPTHIRFSKDTLNIFPYQLDLIWNKLTFSGLGVAPHKVSTQQALIEAVERTPGAIGYIVNSEEAENVHVIHIAK